MLSSPFHGTQAPECPAPRFNYGPDDDDPDYLAVERYDLDDPEMLGLATLPSWGAVNGDNGDEALDVVGGDELVVVLGLIPQGLPLAPGVPGGVGAMPHDGGGGSGGG